MSEDISRFALPNTANVARHKTVGFKPLGCSYNLERTADRVTNICECIIYTVTGGLIKMDEDESLVAWK